MERGPYVIQIFGLKIYGQSTDNDIRQLLGKSFIFTYHRQAIMVGGINNINLQVQIPGNPKFQRFDPQTIGQTQGDQAPEGKASPNRKAI